MKFVNVDVLLAFDELCRQKRSRRSKEDASWWSEEVKEAMSGKTDACNAICGNSTEMIENTMKA